MTITEKFFAKYARAAGNQDERRRLYGLYCTKLAAYALFFALCAAVIIVALVMPEQESAEGMTVWNGVLVGLVIAWLAAAVFALIMALKFRMVYRNILSRPAPSEEMPEVTSYRRKVTDEKKSTFRATGWALILFVACAIFFVISVAVDAASSPESEDMNLLSTISLYAMIIAAVIWAVTLILYNNGRAMQSKNIEVQTAEEAKAIDEAQGRQPQYSLQADKNLQSYKYLFPDDKLRAEIEGLQAKYSKALTISIIVFLLVSAAVTVVFFTDLIAERGLSGYACPVFFTVYFAGVFCATAPYTIKMGNVEKRQKAILESDPAYAKNYEIYKLYEAHNKFKGKIVLYGIALSVIVGFVLAAIFPSQAWSALGVIIVVAALFANRKFVTDLRKKALPIENEIDRLQAEEARSDDEITSPDGESEAVPHFTDNCADGEGDGQ